VHAAVAAVDQALGRREQVPQAHAQADLVQDPVGILLMNAVLDRVHALLPEVGGHDGYHVRYGGLFSRGSAPVLVSTVGIGLLE